MKTIAVIFGSRSTEHDVSIITALAAVIKPLELSKQFRVEAVYVAKDGSWYWDDRLKDIKLYQSNAIDEFLKKTPKAELLFDNGLTLIKQGKLGSQTKCKIDVVFPATHGTYGEDGTLMGLLEMANVAYVGCDYASSTVTMDKVLAKQVTEVSDVANPKWLWCYSKDFLADQTEVLKIMSGLKFPLFVKPAHLGSSIGISKVSDKLELANALEVAAHFDTKIIVEEAVPNLYEVTLPIIGNDKPQAALLEHLLFTSEDFLDFDTKYIGNGKKMGGKSSKRGAQGYSDLPAKLPKDLFDQAVDLGLAVYKILGCSGIARVDMLVDTKAKKVYFNEVNPLPGSLYAHNWRKAGISGVELVTRLVELAEDRWRTKQNLETVFNTSFLKQF